MAGNLYEFVDDNGNVVGQYKSDHTLSTSEINNVHKSYAEAGFLKPENAEKEAFSTRDLEQNKGLQDAYKVFYKRKNGKDFDGSPEELVADYKEQMRYYDTNLGSITMLAGELGSDFYNEEERQALGVMWNAWENTMPFYNENNGKWDAFLDFAEAGVTDLSNWAGMFTAGTATAGSLAAKQLAKAGIRKLIWEGMKKGGLEGAKQGAAWAVPQSVGTQFAKGEVGVGDGVDLKETLVDTAIGAGGGLVLGSTIGGAQGLKQGLTNKANKEAGEAATKKMMGTTDEYSTDDATAEATLDWMYTLGDPNVTGEMRQVARQKFFEEIGDGFHNRIMKNSDVGKSYTLEQSRNRALEVLKSTGLKLDEATFEGTLDHMVKAYNNGKIPANASDHFNALVYQMEDIAFKKFQSAWNSNDKNAAKYMKAAQDAIALSETVSNRAGRALAITKMRERMDTRTYAEVMDNFSKLTGSSDELAAYLAKASEKGGTWRGKMIDGLNEFWIHNILGAFNTLFVNTGGSYVHMLERGGIEIAAGVKNGMTGKGWSQARQGIIQLTTDHMSIASALRYSFKAFAKGSSQLDPHRTVDEMADSITIGNRDFDLSSIGSLGKQKDESWGMYGANLAGNVNRAIGGRGMAMTDELIKQMSFRGKLMSLVMEEHLSKIKSVKEIPSAIAAARREAQDLVNIHIDSIGKGVVPDDMRVRKALEEARTVTFQNDFQNDVFGRLGKGTGSFVNKHPVMRQIMPFVRTPANLLSHFAQRTPGLQNTSDELQKMLSSANPAERARAEMIMNVGTLMWVHAFMMASQDRLQGDGMSDYNRQKTNAASDANLPNSVELEDGTLLSFRKLDPYSRSYRVVANLFDAIKYSDAETAAGRMMDMMGATMKALIDMPTTQGITDLASMLDDFDKAGDILQKKAASMYPYARLVDELFRMSGNEQELYEILGVGDDALEKSTDYLGKTAQKVYPFLRDPNDPIDRKRDPVVGYPLTKPEEMGFAISGIPTKEGKASALREEIDRLGMTVMPPTPVIGGTVDLRKYTVKPDGNQTVYDYYQDLTSRVQIEGYGNPEQAKKGATLEEALTHLVTDDGAYREIFRDSDRYFAVKQRDQNAREKAIRKVIAHYRTIALNELRKDAHLGKAHPVIKALMEAKIETTTNDTQLGNPNPVKQQVDAILSGQ